MALITVNPHDARAYTNGLLELIDVGYVNRETVLQELLCWMSEWEVERFCKATLYLRNEDNECLIGPAVDDDDEAAVAAMLDDFNYVGSRYHY